MADQMGKLREQLDRIEAKLDTIIAAGRPYQICGACGLPIGPLDGYGQGTLRNQRHLTLGPDLVPRHEHCAQR